MRAYCLGFLVMISLAGCQTAATAERAPVYLVRVEAGDTLASIATKFDTSWEKIARLNGMSTGATPKVDSVIRVQPGPGGLVAKKGGTGVASGSHQAAGQGSNGTTAAFDGVDEEYPDVGHHGGLFYGEGDGEAGKTGASLEWPIYGELSSTYGARHGRFHHGIDIRAKKGTTVLAAGAGVVEFAGKQHGYGKTVIIRHRGMKTLYGHLSSINVAVGEKVTHSTELGSTGMSGNSTGPHLHFEIRNLKDQSIDPLTVMSKDKLLSSAR